MKKLFLASLVLVLGLVANASGQEEFVNKTLYDLDMGGIGLDMQDIQDQVSGVKGQITDILNNFTAPSTKDTITMNIGNGTASLSGVIPEGKDIVINAEGGDIAWNVNGSSAARSQTPEAGAAANSQVGAPIKSSVSSSIPVRYTGQDDSETRVSEGLAIGPVYVKGTIDNGVFYPGSGSDDGFIDLDPITGQQRFSDA